jgi:hypothetical protein
MFEKYCIEVLCFLKGDKEKYFEIPFVLSQLGIDTSLASAIRQELIDRGLLTCHIQGCWINDRGLAYLAKHELSNQQPKHELILEFLKPHGIGQFVIINPILSQLFKLNDTHDYSESFQVTQQVKELLSSMESNNLIQLDPTKLNHLGSGNTSVGFKWLDTTTIKASIKSEGLDLLRKEQPKSSGDTFINTGTLIHSSPITNSPVSTYLDQSRPIKIKTQAESKKSQNGFWLKVLKWVGNHIIQILIALLVAYLVFHFGWT